MHPCPLSVRPRRSYHCKTNGSALTLVLTPHFLLPRGLLELNADKTKPIFGLVDASCTPPAQGISDVSKWYNMAMISATAASPSFSDKVLYPNVRRSFGETEFLFESGTQPFPLQPPEKVTSSK
jgi:hypothetical protein